MYFSFMEVANSGRIPYTAEDIRFTRKGNTVYAILLGWPFAGKSSIKVLCSHGCLKEEIQRITMLGEDESLVFTRDKTALTVTLPDQKPCSTAWVLKIETA